MSNKHVNYLDSLRGVAALLVIFTHLRVNTINEKLFETTPAHFLVAGIASVCLFFILSGYVLSYKFLGEPNCKWKIIEATIKRPLRLIGVVLLATYLTLTYDRYLLRLPELESFIYGSLTSPFTFGIKWNMALWTIPVELMGSFLVFGLLFLVGNIKKELRLAIMVVLLFCFINYFYFAFIFGIIIADIAKNWSSDWFIAHKKLISWVLLIPAILLFAYPQGLHGMAANTWNKVNTINAAYILIMSGAMLIFCVVLMNNAIQKLLLYNRFMFLGKVSYSMYAIHIPIIALMSGTVIKFYLCQYFEITILFRCLVSLPVIFIFSWLTDKYIDKPTIKFSSWFAKKLVMKIQGKIKSCRQSVKSYSLSAPVAKIPDTEIKTVD